MMPRLFEKSVLRKVSITAFASLITMSVVLAAIPFTEDFTATTSNDDTQTTATWDTTAPGTLSLGVAESIDNVDFSHANFSGSTNESRGITLGDFDNDGDLDAAVAIKGTVNLLYWSNGGVFDSAPVDLGTDESNTYAIASADLDHDGDIDIVATNALKPSVIYENDGTGVFTEMDANEDVSRRWAVELVDIEGDGDLDIVESVYLSGATGLRNRLSISRYADHGAFEFKPSIAIGSSATDAYDTRALASGDVNGDGLTDLVTGDHNDGNDVAVPNHLHLGNGLGGLADGIEIQSSEAWFTFAVKLADLDGDGHLDLIEGNHPDDSGLGGETRLYMNDGNGTFGPPTLLTGSDATHKTVALLVEDFDRDGDIDILEGNNGAETENGSVSSPKRLFFNDGTGTFPTVIDITPSEVERTYGMAAGDLDGDGLMDYVAANQEYSDDGTVQGHNAAYTMSGDLSGSTFTQLKSEVVSTEFNDSLAVYRRVKLDLDATVPTTASIDFYISKDAGSTWIPTWQNNRTTELDTPASNTLYWRAVLAARSPNSSQLPTINQVTIEEGGSTPQFMGPSTVSGAVGSQLDGPPALNFIQTGDDALTYNIAQVKDGVVVDLPEGTGLTVDVNTGVFDGFLTAADKNEYEANGNSLVIRAFGFNGASVGSSNSAGDIAVTVADSSGNSAPVATSVSIVGSSAVGSTLNGVYNYSDGQSNPEGVSTFRWLRDGVAISGATDSSYTTTNDDAETMLEFEVTPVAASGTLLVGVAVVSAEFAVDAIVNFAPTAGELNITGSAGDGETLTASYTYNDADGDAEGSSTLQWLSDGTAISGATSSTYTLTTDDVGAMISFEVTPVAQTGTLVGATVTSNGVGPVAANAAPTADSVSISGTTQSGETLTGNYSYSDADGDAEGTSTFRWLSDGVGISGATSSTYTLTTDDEGSLISFEVTPVAQTGTTAGTAAESNTVGPITEPPPPPTPPTPPPTTDSGGGGSAGLLDVAVLGLLSLAGGAAARRRRKNGK